MSLSLATSDWMMVTRLIYHINSIDNKEQLIDEFIDLIQSIVSFSAGVFNIVERDKNDKPVNRLSFFNIPQDTHHWSFWSTFRQLDSFSRKMAIIKTIKLMVILQYFLLIDVAT